MSGSGPRVAVSISIANVETECGDASRHPEPGGARRGFTVQLAAHQLHAQRARLPTHERNDPDELGDERRVEQVGFGSVVIHITHKHLQVGGRSQRLERGGEDAVAPPYVVAAFALRPVHAERPPV